MKKPLDTITKYGIRIWKGFMAATPFVLACGLIALLYFFYRVALVAAPVASVQQSILHPRGDASMVCGQDGSANLKDPAPVISDSYQKRIQATSALSRNMITNADLAIIDSDSGQPAGYSHTIEHTSALFEYVKSAESGSYLRTTSSLNMESMPAWQVDAVPVDEGRSYGYSFWYRSSTPVDVTRITTKPDRLDYHYVVTLPATSQWTQFTAEYTNRDEAKQLQVLVSGTEKGTLDTRTYDIHQIPAAELENGMVSVTFDDGWESTYKKALPLLQKYSITTTQYIIAEVATSNVPEYMNVDALKQLREKGHEIGSHSLTHCNQVVLDQKSLEDNAVRSKQLLEAQVGPITSFAYPLGQYNQRTQTTYQKNYPLIRTSDTGYNDRYFDETNIRSMAILDTTSDKEFLSWINYAQRHNVWLVLSYHRVDESGAYNVSSQTLDRQLSMIRESELTVLPVTYAAQAIRGDK